MREWLKMCARDKVQLTSRSTGISDIKDRASLKGMPISLVASASGHRPLRGKLSINPYNCKKCAIWFKETRRRKFGEQPGQVADGEIEVIVGR